MVIVYNPTWYASYVAFTPHYYYFKNTFLVYYLLIPSLNTSNIFSSLKPLTWDFPYLYHSSWDLRKGNPFSSFTSQLTYHSRKIFLVCIIYSFCPILVIFYTHLFYVHRHLLLYQILCLISSYVSSSSPTARK